MQILLEKLGTVEKKRELLKLLQLPDSSDLLKTISSKVVPHRIKKKLDYISIIAEMNKEDVYNVAFELLIDHLGIELQKES